MCILYEEVTRRIFFIFSRWPGFFGGTKQGLWLWRWEMRKKAIFTARLQSILSPLYFRLNEMERWVRNGGHEAWFKCVNALLSQLTFFVAAMQYFPGFKRLLRTSCVRRFKKESIVKNERSDTDDDFHTPKTLLRLQNQGLASILELPCVKPNTTKFMPT